MVVETERPRSRAPAWLRSDAALLAGLFLAAALVSGFTMLRGLDPFDEGLVVQAARRVSEGQVPYADFLWSYGPGEPYLLGGLAKLFGVSLVQWRVLRALADAGVALVAFVLARRVAGPRWALAGWVVAACAMADPRSANPFPYALLAGLGAVALVTGPRRRVVAAAALTALAAAFRLDFAIYAGLAVCAALLPRGVVRYALVAIGLALLVYLPFAIAVGPADLYDALVGVSLRTGDWWTLPFPFSYDGAFRLAHLPHDLKDVLDYYQPLLLVIGLGVGALALIRRRDPLRLALVVFGAGGFAYLLSRTDPFHTTPLYVVLAVLLPAAALVRPLRPGAAVVLALLALHGVADRASALLRPPAMSPVHVAVADGAKAPPAEARAIERMVALVDGRVPPGQPIYVLPRRSDLVRFNAPLVYVLTERDNPTRQDFGLLTGPRSQAAIVATLERVRPRALVRWTDPISSQREPNKRGKPSGVHTLDDWVAAHYRPLAVLYHYTVLVPR